MLTFQEFLVEAIAKPDIEKLRRDAGAFTKNIRRIKNGRELATVAKAFTIWRAHADTYITKSLLGLHSPFYKFDNEEPYWNKQLREKAWPLIGMGSEDVFLARDYHPYVPHNKLSDRSGFAYNSQTAAEWDAIYQTFDAKRSQIYAKLGRMVREAFKALDEYMADATREVAAVPDKFRQEDVNIEGVPVTIVRNETKDANDPYTLGVRSTLDDLRLSFRLLRKRGLAAAFRKVRIEVLVDDGGGDRAGEYDQFGRNGWGTVRIFNMSRSDRRHTIIHELGHHFFRKVLDEPHQHAWTEFIKERKLRFTPDEYSMLRRAYDAAFAAHKDDADGFYVIDNFWEKKIHKYITDPVLKVKMRHWMTEYALPSRQRINLSPFRDGSNYEEHWKEFTTQADSGFLMFGPTEYANNNPEEAFCETFAVYVMQSHPLADMIKATFEEVTGLR